MDEPLPPELLRVMGLEPEWADDVVAEWLKDDVSREWSHQEARRLVRRYREAAEVYALPEPRSLREQLTEADDETMWCVEGLHEQGSSTMLVAESKAGKTTLAMNLVRSLLTGDPFLRQFKVDADEDAKVLFLNYELSESMFKRWFGRMGLGDEENDRLFAYHLRGRRLPPDQPHARAQLVQIIQKLGDVAWVIVDPLQRAFLGDSNNNDEVGAFLEALDALKAEADVPNLLLIDHTGHTEKGRARGASVKAGWPDSTWSLVKENGIRRFAAFGRDVEVKSTPLRFDRETLHLSMGEPPSLEPPPEPLTDVSLVVRGLAEAGGEVAGSEALRAALRGIRTKDQKDALAKASRLGFVERTDDRPYRTRLTEDGREEAERRGWWSP
jgi:hypothetical protein